MTKKLIILSIVAVIIVSLAACSKQTEKLEIQETYFKSGTTDENTVELTKINDSIWVHTTYEKYEGYRTPSNGLVVVTSDGLVLIDTPWTNEQTQELINLTKRTFKQDFSLAIITHAHQDRIGGIDTLLANNIETISSNLTAQLAQEYGYKSPEPKIDTNEKNLKIGETEIEVFYPGEGHTQDNLTVYFPDYNVLFGGCIIKSKESTSIGNTDDANLEEWPNSLIRIKERYGSAEAIIPGHGSTGDNGLINHTLELIEEGK